ncbi:hypothetical protein BCR34DRAFT_563861 [Clohesyomyces aquaticus]|uniref:Uncharacterized protein n=1 Tax=Clohesyomyces aquaticus TaxID=1231657 RepID=A0A1Y1ZPX4_9PLEO|nr:hypothetical protein BCR34DRAFT_563861 [Clohesyomyces aquaticus]
MADRKCHMSSMLRTAYSGPADFNITTPCLRTTHFKSQKHPLNKTSSLHCSISILNPHAQNPNLFYLLYPVFSPPLFQLSCSLGSSITITTNHPATQQLPAPPVPFFPQTSNFSFLIRHLRPGKPIP